MKGQWWAIVLLLSAGDSCADEFINAETILHTFHNFVGSPYDPFFDRLGTEYGHSVWIPVDCERIAKQADLVADLTASHKQMLEVAEQALSANNEAAAEAARRTVDKLSRQILLSGNLLKVIQARPIFYTWYLSPDDPVEDFLVRASVLELDPSSWLRDLKFETLSSALPLHAWSTVYSPMEGYINRGDADFSPANFQQSSKPELKPWLQSVGRKRENFPFELGSGFLVNDDIRCPRVAGEVNSDCAAKVFSLSADLTQGQYCSTKSPAVSFKVSYNSPLFRQRVHITYNVGRRVEDAAATAARLEGHNRALDDILKSFIVDVLGSVQLYRVSDELIAPLDAGTYYKGSMLEVNDLSGNPTKMKSEPLREAFNIMNDRLAESAGSPSDEELRGYFATPSRYSGRTISSRDGKLSFNVVEFRYTKNGSSARIGFFVENKSYHGDVGVRVAYVNLNDEPLYYSRPILCGSYSDFLNCP